MQGNLAIRDVNLAPFDSVNSISKEVLAPEGIRLKKMRAISQDKHPFNPLFIISIGYAFLGRSAG